MGVCDVPVISNVCDAAGEAAATLVSAPFDWLASTMGQAAGWLIEAMWTVFDSTTLVDVTADGYLDVYNLLFGIGVFIVVLFFCFQLILGLIRREPQALSRAALGAAKAVLGSFLVMGFGLGMVVGGAFLSSTFPASLIGLALGALAGRFFGHRLGGANG